MTRYEKGFYFNGDSVENCGVFTQFVTEMCMTPEEVINMIVNFHGAQLFTDEFMADVAKEYGLNREIRHYSITVKQTISYEHEFQFECCEDDYDSIVEAIESNCYCDDFDDVKDLVEDCVLDCGGDFQDYYEGDADCEYLEVY